MRLNLFLLENVYPARSILRPLLAWWRKEPGHRQPWFWHSSPEYRDIFRKISNIRRNKSQTYMFLASSCSCLCPRINSKLIKCLMSLVLPRIFHWFTTGNNSPQISREKFERVDDDDSVCSWYGKLPNHCQKYYSSCNWWSWKENGVLHKYVLSIYALNIYINSTLSKSNLIRLHLRKWQP